MILKEGARYPYPPGNPWKPGMLGPARFLGLGICGIGSALDPLIHHLAIWVGKLTGFSSMVTWPSI